MCSNIFLKIQIHHLDGVKSALINHYSHDAYLIQTYYFYVIY